MHLAMIHRPLLKSIHSSSRIAIRLQMVVEATVRRQHLHQQQQQQVVLAMTSVIG
jgi:hypothetical protein